MMNNSTPYFWHGPGSSWDEIFPPKIGDKRPISGSSRSAPEGPKKGIRAEHGVKFSHASGVVSKKRAKRAFL